MFEVKYQRKDPSKVAHQKHFSFELTFTKLGGDWYAQIVPSWYYSYDGYTRGTVDFYKTYPGMYVPSPLKITVYEQDSSLESLCDEILGLTKMNWNNTQMDGRLPITLECARKIGDIMKYVGPNEKPQVSYSFYM